MTNTEVEKRVEEIIYAYFKAYDDEVEPWPFGPEDPFSIGMVSRQVAKALAESDLLKSNGVRITHSETPVIENCFFESSKTEVWSGQTFETDPETGASKRVYK